MTNMHLIISREKIDFLPKERYLKFIEYACIDGFFIYTRMDYRAGIIKMLSADNYLISRSGKELLTKVQSVTEIYWAVIQLGNREGEEISLKYLNLLKKQACKKISMQSNEPLVLNTMYDLN